MAASSGIAVSYNPRVFGLVTIKPATSSGCSASARASASGCKRPPCVGTPTVSKPLSEQLAGFVPCALSGMNTLRGLRPLAVW